MQQSYLGQLYLIYQTSFNITFTLNHDFSIILLLSCPVLSQDCKNRSLLNCNKQTNAYLNNLNWSENSGGKKKPLQNIMTSSFTGKQNLLQQQLSSTWNKVT